jgi:hypothetical protein
MPYSDVPNNSLIRVLKHEMHGERLVKNEGVFVKIAQSHARHLTTHKDAIFAGRIPCRVIHNDWRISDGKAA